MADRYPNNEDFGRRERWRSDDDRRDSGRGRYARGDEQEDDDRAGFGGYGGGYGQGMSGQGYGGAEQRGSESGMGGLRGQSYGGGRGGRSDWDREFGQDRPDSRGAMGQYGGGRYNSGLGWDEPGRSIASQGYGQDYRGAGAQGDQWGQLGNQDRGRQAERFGQSGGYGSRQESRSGQSLWSGGRQWGQHSGRGPKNYSRSDDRIRDDVNDRLTDDPHVDASEITVEVSGGEVTLTGTVDSREAKRHAEDCAESVSGVKHVQNNLRIQQQSGTLDQGETKNSRKGGRGESDKLQ